MGGFEIKAVCPRVVVRLRQGGIERFNTTIVLGYSGGKEYAHLRYGGPLYATTPATTRAGCAITISNCKSQLDERR